jgi:aspartate aminotransferase
MQVGSVTAALAPWLAPQERFDALRATALAAGGARFCDLAYANAWGGPPPEVREILHRAAGSAGDLDLQYTPYGGAIVPRRHAAQALARRTGLPFKHDHLVLTPGAMSALSLLIRALPPGGNVVIPVPTWLDHPLYVAADGREPRLVPLREADFLAGSAGSAADFSTGSAGSTADFSTGSAGSTADFGLDLDALAQAIDADTRAVILTCPGNPTGKLFGAQELTALAALLDRAPSTPLLISDECHRDFVREAFVSPVTSYARTAVVYSYGKRFLVQGQRLGYAAISPRHPEATSLAAELRRLARALGHGTPTALMQQALPDLEALAPDVASVLARKERTRARLEAAGLEVRGDATMFLYVKVDDDWAATEALAQRGVLVLPAAIFHHRGWIRLTASAREDMLERGLEHVITALGGVV